MKIYRASSWGIVLHIVSILLFSAFLISRFLFGTPYGPGFDFMFSMSWFLAVLYSAVRLVTLLAYKAEINGDLVHIKRRDFTEISFNLADVMDVCRARSFTFVIFKYGDRTDVVEIPRGLYGFKELINTLSGGRPVGRMSYNRYTEMWLKRPSR